MITLTEEGSIRLKLIDLADLTSLDHKGFDFYGTEDYMSPERFKCQDHLAGPADMFSLGSTLLTVLFREFPFGGGKVNCSEHAEYEAYFNTPATQRNPVDFLQALF